MEFTYAANRKLLFLLRGRDYVFRDYYNYRDAFRCVILRHDIDNGLSQVVKLAELEADEGVKSIWFVLLRTDFYNIMSKAGQEALGHIQSPSHEIGLHFDETFYVSTLGSNDIVQSIIKECRFLSGLRKMWASCISMHCPSKTILEADYAIFGLVNFYRKIFFNDFKYLSDGHRKWWESALDIIRTGDYERLNILLHAFRYHEKDEEIIEMVEAFIRSAKREQHWQMAENITDLPSIIGEEKVL